ncbi:hypothetical protein [Afipia sp. Root123D2]|uniref:hypothetical protein n=1 Tax=Afipia sp. Root123D2 TaxID=1736436 RepID=UPI0012E7AE04|nr:hypothetical protein [Afipia sp. Root123D2]
MRTWFASVENFNASAFKLLWVAKQDIACTLCLCAALNAAEVAAIAKQRMRVRVGRFIRYPEQRSKRSSGSFLDGGKVLSARLRHRD